MSKLLCMLGLIISTSTLMAMQILNGPSKLRESKYPLISQLKRCYYAGIYQAHKCENCEGYNFEQLIQDSQKEWNNQEAVDKLC